MADNTFKFNLPSLDKGLDPITNLPSKDSKKPVFNLPKLGNQPATISSPIESKYDVGTFPGQNLEQVRAERQGIGEELMYTAARIPLVTGTKILSGVSGLGEFVINTGRAASQGSLDPYFDTPVSDAVNKIEESLKTNMPLYNEVGDRDKNFLQRAFTDKEFWMDEILTDAVPFLASAYLTGYGTTKMLQPLTESIYASKLANATKMGMQELEALKAAGATSEVIEEIKAANALRKAGLAATKNSINRLVTTGVSRSVESLVEGAQTKKVVYDSLIQQGYSPEEAKTKAATAALAVAGMNMLLAPLDYDQYSGWFKTFSKSRDVLTKGSSMGRTFLKHSGRNAFTEGILEEGLQNAMQQYAQAKYTGQYGDADIAPLEGVLSEYFRGFGTKEGWDSMGIGMIVGGLFGGVTQALGDKSKSERYDNLKNLIASNDYLSENFTDFVKEDPTTGQPIFNKNKIVSLFAQMGNDGLLSDAMTNQLINNYEEAYKAIDNIRFGNWAFTHFEAGQGEALVKKIQDLGELDAEELKQQGILTNDMKNSEGKLLTPKEISQRYLDKALEYEKLYNQVSSRFDLPNRAALKNVFDEAVLQKETTVSLNNINNKISSLQSDINARNMAMGTPEFLETIDTPMPKTLEEQELEMLQNRKQDLINTLKDSYIRLDEWTSPEKLAAKAKAAEELRKESEKKGKASALANKLSADPNYKMSKDETRFYQDNKETVDKQVKSPKPAEQSQTPTEPVKPLEKVGKAQKFGEPGEINFTQVRYENGFPVYGVKNPDGTVSEYSAKEGWAAVDSTDVEKTKGKEVLGSKNHFGNLFKYRASFENNTLDNIRAQVKKEDGSFYSKEELLEMFPEAFPSLRATEVLKTVMKRPDWTNFISMRADKKYAPGTPFELRSGLYGNRAPIDVLLSVTDPTTGEVHEVHHPENPYFYNYQTESGEIKLIDFTAITLDQFNSMFTIGYDRKTPVTQDELDTIKQQWFDLKQFFDKVNAWYVDNNLDGSQEIPKDWFKMSPTAALDIIKDPKAALTPVTSVPAFADSAIVSAYDQSSINGKPIEADAPDIPNTKFTNAYFVYFKDANGYKVWVRVTPKKIVSGQEIVDRVNQAVSQLYDINPDIVGTPEGDAAANKIIEDLNIYVAAGDKSSVIPKIEFSAFRPEGKFRYYLQLESSIKIDDAKKRGKLIFEQNDQPVTFENEAEINEFFYKKRDKIGGVILSSKTSFREGFPKGIVDPNAAENFDAITTPKVVQDYTVRFSFGNILPAGDALGLESFKPVKPVTKPAPENQSLESEIAKIDEQLASGKLSEKDARNLANKKVNLQNKLAKVKPIETDVETVAAAAQFLSYTPVEAISEYISELLSYNMPVDTEELDVDSFESIVKFLEVQAKSSDSVKSKAANVVLNKLVGSMPQLASTALVSKDPVDEMLEKWQQIESTGGRIISIKTPGKGIENMEVPPIGIENEVPPSLDLESASEGFQSEQDKIAQEVAARKAKKGGISFDNAGEKVGYIAPGEPWTVQQAAEWLKRILPASISVEEISPLMAKLKNGNIRYGYFKENVIALTNKAPRTLAFHEAFHAIFRAVLTNSERAQVIDAVRKELNLSTEQLFVKVNRLRASNPENYGLLSDKEMEDRVFEEELADRYAAWQNKRGTHRGIFQKIFDLIKRIADFFYLSNPIDSLFRKIEKGAFVKSTVNPGFKESADKILGLLSPIKSQEVVNNVAGAYFSKRSNSINATIEDVMDEYMRLYDPLKPENIKLVQDKPNLKSPLNNLYYVYSNPEERAVIKEQVKQVIKDTRYNPYIEDQEEFEGDSEANGGSDTERVHDKSNQEYDPYDKIGSEVKRFFATTSYETVDEFNNVVIKSLDPRSIYSRLLPALSASSISRNAILPKLELLAKTDPVIKAVYDRLVKVTGVSEETPNGTGSGKAFLNRFKLAFQVYQYKYTQSLINPGKQSRVIYVNKTDLGKYALERWENEFRQYVFPKLRDSAFKNDIINNGLNKALRYWESNPAQASDFLYQALVKLKINVNLDYIHHSLKLPGLDTNPELFKDVQFITKDFVTALKTAINSEVDIYGKEEEKSLVTRLKNVASGNAMFDENIILPNFKTADGKMMYSYSEGNFVMEAAQALGVNSKSAEWVRTQMSDPRFKHNVLFNNGTTEEARLIFAQSVLSNAEVAITGPIKDELTGKGVTTKNLDVHSAQMNYLSMFSTDKPVAYGRQGNFRQTLYWLTQVAEKNNQIAAALPKMEYAVVDENGNMAITAAAQEHLYQMFLQEEVRIQHVKDGNKLGYLNGGRVYFEYLEGIKPGSKNAIIEQILYGLHDSSGKPNGRGLIQIIDNYVSEEVEANNLKVAIDPELLKSAYKDNVRTFVADLIINDFIWTNSYLQLMGMDLGVAKNFEDFVKRAAMLIAAGQPLNSDESTHVISYTEDTIEYVDKETFKRLEGDQKNNPKAKGININDAQVYSIPQSLLLDLEFQGKIDEPTRRAYERIISPLETTYDENGKPYLVYVPVTKEESDLTDLLPKKEVIGGISKDGKTVYQKMAVAWLTPELTSYWDVENQKWVARPGQEVLHNKREHLEKMFADRKGTSTVHLAPKSASKLFFPKDVLSSKSFETGEAVGRGTVTEITNNYRREQVYNATKLIDSIVYSLQQHAISGSELLDDTGKALKARQEAAFAALRNSAFADAANLVRKVNSDGTISEADLEVFLESVRNQILASTPDSQLYEFMQSDGFGGFKYSPNLVHVASKFESLFLSTFKEAFRIKIAGRKATLQSDDGMTVIVEIATGKIITRIEQAETENQLQYLDKTKYTSRRLNFMQEEIDSEGNSRVKPAEIMMTRKRAELLGINITDPRRDDYMRVITTRIPTQNYHSIMPAVIVDFLPEYYGDTVIGPKELVLMMGADFDVDALYTYMQDFWIKNGKTIKYGEETTPRDKYLAYNYWNLNNNKILNDQLEKRIDSDPRIEQIKSLLSAKKELAGVTEELKTLIRHNLSILEEAGTEKGQPEMIGKIVSELSEKLLIAKMESGDIRTILEELGDLSAIYKQHTEDAMRSVGMPGTFEEWQAAGSPVSRGELYNNLFEINYEMFTQGTLWDAYKQYLDTTSVDNAIKKVDENPANKVKPLRLGNSIPSKAVAFKINSASTPLRGVIVSSNVAGMFMRQYGIRLKEGIDFVDREGNYLTYFAFPTIDTTASREEVLDQLQNVRNISDVGSQMVGLVIDDPKEPKLYKLNWNINTLPAIAEAISLGMPQDFVFKLFALPVFKQLDSAITRKTRIIAPETGGKTQAKQELTGIYLGFGIRLKAILDLTKRFTNEELEILASAYSTTMNGESIDNSLVYAPKTRLTDSTGALLSDGKIAQQFKELSIEELAKEIQYYSTLSQALDFYNRLSNNSQYRASTLTPISTLNRKVGSSLDDVNGIIDAIDLLENVEDSPYENLKEAVYANENLANNISNIRNVQDITRLYFLKQTPFFSYFASAVRGITKPFLKLSDKEALSRHMMAGLVSHAVNMLTKGKDFTYLLESGGESSIVKMYEELMDIPEFRDNPLVKWAYPKKYNAKDPSSYYPIDTLKFDTFTKLDPALNERLIDGHTSLVNSSNEKIAKFGRSLFWYAFAKDGLMFKAEAASKFLTPEAFIPVVNVLDDLQSRSGEDFEDAISDYFGESVEKIRDRFTENFMRHKAFQRFLNFNNAKNFTTFNPSGKRSLPLFKMVIGDGVVKFDYSGLGTPEQANEHLRKNNIPIIVRSALEGTLVDYPKFLAISISEGYGKVSYVRLKLTSSEQGLATYKILEPFGDYEMTISPFPKSPEENQQMYKQFAKSSGRVAPSIDYPIGSIPYDEIPFDAGTQSKSTLEEALPDNYDSFADFSTFEEAPSNFSAPEMPASLESFKDYQKASEGEIGEALQGLKKFEKPGKDDFDPNDISTKCK